MRITLLAVGKIKEKYLADAVAEYSKRLGRYAKLSIVEADDEKTPENASPKEEEAIKAREGARLLAKIPADAYVIALAIEGKQPDSVELSEHIRQLALSGRSHLAFLIGGSLGLSREVLERADEKLSFSRLTFPHQLMRVILLEQIYRSFRIARNEPYHK
ncbi:MAG: 23S rRNA (pseudouridine(1915)-N(3))-methyltransferase RlmH [Lachnospiraceae bacterium]|nr:23S rRNA (pseudouridine(1915)-N(3))-methyltransferase RlmH [Lachnospiraceae bacterium]